MQRMLLAQTLARLQAVPMGPAQQAWQELQALRLARRAAARWALQHWRALLLLMPMALPWMLAQKPAPLLPQAALQPPLAQPAHHPQRQAWMKRHSKIPLKYWAQPLQKAHRLQATRQVRQLQALLALWPRPRRVVRAADLAWRARLA